MRLAGSTLRAGHGRSACFASSISILLVLCMRKELYCECYSCTSCFQIARDKNGGSTSGGRCYHPSLTLRTYCLFQHHDYPLPVVGRYDDQVCLPTSVFLGSHVPLPYSSLLVALLQKAIFLLHRCVVGSFPDATHDPLCSLRGISIDQLGTSYWSSVTPGT